MYFMKSNNLFHSLQSPLIPSADWQPSSLYPLGGNMKNTGFVRQFAWILLVLTLGGLPASAESFRIISWGSSVELNGTEIPGGNYGVSWKSHKTGALVTFLTCEHPIAIAQGKWVKRDSRYKIDSILYETKEDGSRTLLEVRFAGMNRALVFGESESEAKVSSSQSSR